MSDFLAYESFLCHLLASEGPAKSHLIVLVWSLSSRSLPRQALDFFLLRVSRCWDYSQMLSGPALTSVQFWLPLSYLLNKIFWISWLWSGGLFSIVPWRQHQIVSPLVWLYPVLGAVNGKCQCVSANKCLWPNCKQVQDAEGMALMSGAPRVQSTCPVGNAPVSYKHLPGSCVRNLTTVKCSLLVTSTKITNVGKTNLKVK